MISMRQNADGNRGRRWNRSGTLRVNHARGSGLTAAGLIAGSFVTSPIVLRRNATESFVFSRRGVSAEAPELVGFIAGTGALASD